MTHNYIKKELIIKIVDPKPFGIPIVKQLNSRPTTKNSSSNFLGKLRKKSIFNQLLKFPFVSMVYR